ncbi:hypothetical protein [Lysinibacillus sphaericus]|uniref:hypothetical protein n=1 Tax=Lysinibacillus sphaericus TaxID=1421 RepID=UPI0004DF11CF|nr:hypothetical protein [Lysinibacillus sphaericus]MBG9694397.1 hypothetical protein [Lysinibacillus sphaericus]QPA57449.1 hypothetical protein INQ55_14755 [Lysinibacillus sphaericus]QTB21093.1 hypothetical protein J1907_15035 [Lysinibacillus sphaericus]
MINEWYEGTELQNKIPNFKSTDVKFITDFHYFIGYNSYYNQISFLEISFLLEVDSRKFILKMKFNDVTTLDLLGFGNSYNQITGFRINNLKDKGFELPKKYLVEDYENNIIKFFCASFEVLSLVEI